MRRVAIHEPRPLGETVRHTALRAGVGGLVAFHAVQKLHHVHFPSGLFQAHSWSLADWELTLPFGVVVAAELLCGVGLALGFLSRTSATLAALLAVLAMVASLGEAPISWEQFEASLLLCGTCLYLAAAGGGDFSVDHGLRERARRLAIQRDEIWSRPTYVPLNE